MPPFKNPNKPPNILFKLPTTGISEMTPENLIIMWQNTFNIIIKMINRNTNAAIVAIVGPTIPSNKEEICEI
jgi:hypothetical protein